MTRPPTLAHTGPAHWPKGPGQWHSHTLAQAPFLKGRAGQCVCACAPGRKRKRRTRASECKRPRRLRRPKPVGQDLDDLGLVDFGGVVCLPDVPKWWEGERAAGSLSSRNLAKAKNLGNKLHKLWTARRALVVREPWAPTGATWRRQSGCWRRPPRN
jgi:hypothetical protein